MSYFRTDQYQALGMPQRPEPMPKARASKGTAFQKGYVWGLKAARGTKGYEPYTETRLTGLAVTDPGWAQGYRLGWATGKAMGVVAAGNDDRGAHA